MRTLSRRLAALGAFFVVGLAAAGCGSGVPGNSVAVVAGNPITLKAFHHWLYIAAASQSASSGAPVIVPSNPPGACVAQARKEIPALAKTPTKTLDKECKALFTQLSGEVMSFLITSYWYQAEAAREHVKVTDAMVTKSFNTIKKQQFPTEAQFKAFLAQRGFTVADILYSTRISVVQQQLVKHLTHKVTPAQIAAYYKSHLTQFGTPETRDMRIVLAKTKGGALAAKSALIHHQSWSKVAKKYSTDPTTKNSGGLLVGVRKGQDDPALDDAAFVAPINKLLGPVKGAFGYYIFEVTKITPATQQTLAQSTTLIEQTLKGQQATAIQNKLVALVKKHWKSQTTCQSTFAIPDCANYHAPSGTGTSSAGGTASAPPATTSAPTSTK